jgi:hypothetical protein
MFMEFPEMLQMGRNYSNEWIVGGFFLSLLLSLGLRTIPLTLGSDLVWLYYLPFWLIIEIILISLFTIYGLLAIVFSIAIDVNLRAGLFVWPSVLFFSDILFLIIVTLYIERYRDVPYAVDQREFFITHPIIILIIYSIIMFAITRIFSVNMSEAAWTQLFSVLPSTFLLVYYGGIFFWFQFFDRWTNPFESLTRLSGDRTDVPERSTNIRRPRPSSPHERSINDSRGQPSPGDYYMGRRNPESEEIVYVCPHCGWVTPPGNCLRCRRPVG